jgi:diadenosine tetraphosphatase ApaH/serine/threonine PP2A family protein phosphatase
MISAILSDIHANFHALERVLADAARQGAERYLVCGDVVGYGAQPNDCCDAVRALGGLVVRGNHDEAAVRPAKEEWFNSAARACIQWTRGVLTEANLEFLRELPPVRQVPGAHVCHGSLPDPDLYTTGPLEALASLTVMEEQVCFLGHTHCAEWYTYRNDNRPPSCSPRPEGGYLELVEGRRYVINPGGVGQPRYGNSQASYAVWDSDAHTVEIRRISYDVAAAQALIYEAGLPPSMAERLRYGV